MPMSEFVQTPSQTVGPFYHYALPYEGGAELVDRSHPAAIRVHGTVLDGAGEPVPDALLEFWQADEHGVLSTELGSFARDGYSFTGFGRVPTTQSGRYSVTTVKPGAVGSAAPYVLVTVFARGLLHHLFTRMYFPEDTEAHAADTVLSSVAEERRATLIAVADAPASYGFDIRLQGEGETVFLEFS